MKRILLPVLLISASPLIAALPGGEGLAKLIMSQFDTNADKLLDAGEWQAGVAKGFDQMDTNGDGSITEGEIDGLTEEIAKETGDLAAGVVVALIKKVIMSLDADGSKTVSRKEYTGKAEGIFKKLDSDSDGKVTMAELEELPLRVAGL